VDIFVNNSTYLLCNNGPIPGMTLNVIITKNHVISPDSREANSDWCEQTCTDTGVEIQE
jgi:hypothetical protein